MKSSYRTDSASGSVFYTAYHVSYPCYSILTGKSILDNLIGKSGASCDSIIKYIEFEGRMWDLIVSVPDHCLSFYCVSFNRAN